MADFILQEEELKRRDEEIDASQNRLQADLEDSDNDSDNLLGCIVNEVKRAEAPKRKTSIIETEVQSSRGLDLSSIPKGATIRLQQQDLKVKSEMIQNLKQKIRFLECEQKRLTKELREERINKRSIIKKDVTSSNELLGLKVRYEKILNENKEMRKVNSQQSSAISKLEKQNQTLTVKLSRCDRSLSASIQQRANHLTEINKLKEELNKCQKKNGSLTTKNLQLEDDNKMLTQCSKDQFQVLHTLKAQLSTLQAMKMLSYAEKEFQSYVR